MIHRVTLLKKEYIADQTMAFHFTRPASFQYQAGQFVDLAIESKARTDEQSMVRTLSLVSAPHEKELVVAVRMRDSAFKQELAALETGSSNVTISDALGTVVLPDVTHYPIVMIAGGIGIAPFISLLRHVTHHDLPYSITLLYSNVRPRYAAYLEELYRIAQDRNSVSFIPTMTRITEEDRWQGQTGRLNELVLKEVVDSTQGSLYFLAGTPAMVRDIRRTLNSLGVEHKDVIFEEFSGY